MSASLSEAIGQLIIGKVQGVELDDGNKACLKNGTIGGITLFKENVESIEQLMNLCDAIRLFSFHPKFIAVDQEGGPVQRLDHIISPIPSMMALGQLEDLSRLNMVINIAARQLSLLGINCVLAPVLDINTNPANPIIGTRAFSSAPDKVAKLGAAVIRSYMDAGLLPVAKHFPGHGDTDMDSHLALPKLSCSRERLEEIELYPFKENLLLTPAILIAHLWIECLDPGETLPSSLSYNVCTKLLKEDLAYQRLLVSDDMLMKAITNKWGLAEACVRAIEAGLDLLLVCSSADDCMLAHTALMAAVKNGRISEERIAQSIRARNAALKMLPAHDEIERGRRVAAMQKSIAAAEPVMTEASTAAIELSRGIPRIIFLAESRIDLFVPEHPRYPLNYFDELLAELPSLKGRLVEHRYPLSPSAADIEKMQSACGDNCILASFRARINKEQLALAEALREKSKRHLLIASDVPYDLDVLPDWDDAVCVFDPSDLAVKAFAKLMKKQLSQSLK